MACWLIVNFLMSLISIELWFVGTDPNISFNCSHAKSQKALAGP